MKIVNKEKKKSLFPLLKGLKTSQSTPINGAQAQINFFKNDNVETDAKHFIFATDAIVDHPLRIGVGYGSYICYSCTILSDKVNHSIEEEGVKYIYLFQLFNIGSPNYCAQKIFRFC